MSVLWCCTEGFRTISRAAAKAAKARLRRMGLGSTAADWVARASECERCPLRVIRSGVSYCGRPFTEMIARDPAIDGCGCPTRAKAQDPYEHCPLDRTHRPTRMIDGRCNCKWCELQQGWTSGSRISARK